MCKKIHPRSRRVKEGFIYLIIVYNKRKTPPPRKTRGRGLRYGHHQSYRRHRPIMSSPSSLPSHWPHPPWCRIVIIDTPLPFPLLWWSRCRCRPLVSPWWWCLIAAAVGAALRHRWWWLDHPPCPCPIVAPCEQSLVAVVGGAAVVSVWSCYFVIAVIIVLIPRVPVSCSSFPVLLSLVVPPLSLPLPTYSPCEQGLAAVVADGGVVGCCLGA